jgi:hypothetical protein
MDGKFQGHELPGFPFEDKQVTRTPRAFSCVLSRCGGSNSWRFVSANDRFSGQTRHFRSGFFLRLISVGLNYHSPCQGKLMYWWSFCEKRQGNMMY